MDCADLSKKIAETLGLDVKPVAVKFLKPGEAIPEGFALPSRRMRFCQAVMEAGWGRALAILPNEMACGPGPGSFGGLVKEKVSKGEVHRAFGLFESDDAAAKCLGSNTKMMPGSVSAVLVAPLSECRMEPDTVIARVNAEQAMWLCHSRSFHEGKHLTFDVQTEACLCSGMAVAPYLKNEVQLGFGCYGSRSNTDLSANEILVGIPGSLLERVVAALERLGKPIGEAKEKKGFHQSYPEKTA